MQIISMLASENTLTKYGITSNGRRVLRYFQRRWDSYKYSEFCKFAGINTFHAELLRTLIRLKKGGTFSELRNETGMVTHLLEERLSYLLAKGYVDHTKG